MVARAVAAVLLAAGVLALAGQSLASEAAPVVTVADADELTAQGRRHERGDGVDRDWERARSFYEDAIAAGGTDALWRLGRLLVFDHGDPFDEPERGRELLLRAAGDGDSRAAWDLAVMHYRGIGIEPDRRVAARWARAAAADVVDARMMLANLYYDGDGVEPDLEAARDWAARAAEADVAEGALMLGRMLLRGEGGERDVDAAVEALEQAHHLGSGQALRLFARVLSDGRHREPDFSRVREVYEHASRRGDPQAQLAYARWLVTWNPDGPEIDEAWFWVRVAAPYRGRLDAVWDDLWDELDHALRARLDAAERDRIRDRAEAWVPE